MKVAIWAILPLMFIFGRWEPSEKIYFPHLALIFLIIAAVLVNSLKRRSSVPKTLIVVALVFTLSTIFSSANALDLEALPAATQLLLFVLALFLPCLLVNDENSLRSFVLALLTGALTNAIAGLVQSGFWIASNGFVLIADGQWFRVTGLALTPADYVFQLTIGLVLTEALDRGRSRVLTQALFWVCLLISNSRAALIILMLYSSFALVRASKPIFLRLVVALSLIVSLAATSSFGRLIIERATDIFNYDFNEKRFITFENAIQQITSDGYHFLIGHGYGAYRFDHPIDNMIYNNTHNIYLHLLFSGGIIGFISFCSIIFYLYLRINWTRNNIRNNSLIERSAHGNMFLLFVIIISGLVETTLVGVGSGWSAGLCLGCGLAAYRLSRRRCGVTTQNPAKEYKCAY